jgi:diguanylate cyclase (GGDEF)-like protein/PAS domain S-box-containing protein
MTRAHLCVPTVPQLEHALNAIGSPVLVTDAEHRITWCSAGFSRLSGHGLGEALGRRPSELLHFEGTDAATVTAMRSALGAKKPFKGQFLHRAKSGHAYWVAVDIQPIFDEHGHLEGFVAAHTDVTESVLDQDHLRGIVNSAAAGIIVQDAQGTIIGCNPEAERLLGLGQDKLLGGHPLETRSRLHSEDGLPLSWEQHPATRTLRSGQEVVGEVLGVALHDGRQRWVQVSCRLIKGRTEGAQAVISSFIDVTAQRTALAELAAERRRLDATLDGTQAGVWEWNLQTGEARVNERWAKISGYTLAELGPVSLQTWAHSVHPDDLPHLKDHRRRHVAGELAFFDASCRMRHKEGRWIWVGLRGRIASRTGDGRAQWMYGTCLDIDEVKQRELELQRANAKLKGLFELSPVGIALNDLADARFLEFNEALLSMTGYDRAELAALRHADVCPPECKPEVARQRELLISVGRYGPYETELLHKDGHRIAVQLAGMRVVLPDGAERIWSIIQDIGPRKRMEEQLRHEARTDRLTGLPNRAMLMERLQASLTRCQADESQRFALLFIDFDRFKLVNDTLGHDAGDQLLRLIADRLCEALRAGDILGSPAEGNGSGNLVARLGGDEFVVLLHDVHGADDVARVANRLMNVFANPYVVRSKEIHSSASIGIVLADSACESADSVLRDADMAMYEAKRAGRSTLAFFDPGMLTRLKRAVRIEEALRHAIQLDQLSVVYQPIVNLETGRVNSAEALLRWRHPELGDVSPSEFIPIAEESGLIIAIGEWVLWQACRQWRRWQQEAPEIAPDVISVNLSRVEMSLGDRLLDRVAAVLAEVGMQPRQLQLEVTEREVMREPAGARRLMNGLRAMGVLLAMDDFGTGASSLGCLREYPFDVIKIDKSFIDDLAGRADMLAVTHATVSVIENLGMVSVAEGIEHEVQVGILQSLGCRHGQGYFFSRPVAGERLLDAVRARAVHAC